MVDPENKYNKKHNVGAGLVSAHAITLITLVITIVVLIILAGVSISSMLTGNNGILRQTIKAKEETEAATELEQVQLAVASAMMSNNQILTKDNLKKELDTSFDNVTITGESALYYRREK